MIQWLKEFFYQATMILALWSMIAIMMVVTLDGLEYEQTGKCEGCILFRFNSEPTSE